jgi:hypothetical protein
MDEIERLEISDRGIARGNRTKPRLRLVGLASAVIGPARTRIAA